MPNPNFEASGDIENWPRNVPGKPTQAAVFGVLHPKKGKHCEIIWTGQFPDLEPAMYWAAKKEVQAVRKDKWIVASRVLWQHELTPQQAVDTCFKQMSAQLDEVMSANDRGDGEPPALGFGPIRPVDLTDGKGHYVELVKEGDDAADPLGSFFLPPMPKGGDEERDDQGNDGSATQWIPRDPRRE